MITVTCGLRHGEPHEPHGECGGRAPEYPSERVLSAAEAIKATAALIAARDGATVIREDPS